MATMCSFSSVTKYGYVMINLINDSVSYIKK